LTNELCFLTLKYLIRNNRISNGKTEESGATASVLERIVLRTETLNEKEVKRKEEATKCRNFHSHEA
jgi:hypothetical protein